MRLGHLDAGVRKLDAGNGNFVYILTRKSSGFARALDDDPGRLSNLDECVYVDQDGRGGVGLYEVSRLDAAPFVIVDLAERPAPAPAGLT